MMVLTWDLLVSLGFSKNRNVMSDRPGGLSIDLGNLKLSASLVINRSFQEVVMLCGVISTSRSIAMIETEMPREVESREQGIAWVTWSLDSHVDDGMFTPVVPVPWLAVGRQNRHLLPWDRDLAAYAARPLCQAQRDWVRMSLRKLSEAVAGLDDEAVIIFQFDGEVLSIRCASTTLIAMPASGKRWPMRYSLKAKQLRYLPKRLMREMVTFAVWDSALTIGSLSYKGVVELGSMERGNEL